MEQEIAQFFRDFILRLLAVEHADPNNPKSVKMVVMNHYENFYPAFIMTPIYQRMFNTDQQSKMIEEYRHNMTLLLIGRIPEGVQANK